METSFVLNSLRKNFVWSTAIVFAIFHAGAIAAFFYFDWKPFLASTIALFLLLSWGIGMGYHRLLTHRSYVVPKWIEYFLTICATLTLEGGPLFWVGTHRIHHQNSDKPGDPHSPRDGAWWAHILWMVYGTANHNNTGEFMRYVPDLSKDRFHRWLNTYHYVPLTVLGILLGFFGGLPWVLWGVFFRVTVGLHFTWLVNSATHLWGPRRFETRDDSRNNAFVAAVTFGEGWHNNHHAHPNSAKHGLAWYEVDITWYQIRLLEMFGVATKVKVVAIDEKLRQEAA
ncbi:MAG: fatty acid desaturase [Acidobacteria bacterium]|nr:fatty acid desaturase [Acidobacteriota bacterium]